MERPCELGGLTAPKFGSMGGKDFAAIELSEGFPNLPENMACEVLFHELMHVAGVRQGAHHDAKGDDTLYSCGRVCSGCSHASVGAGDDHLDCAKCAEPTERKEVCGLKVKVTEERRSDPGITSCLYASGTTVRTATCVAKEVLTLTCDNKQSRAKPGVCCDSCPDGLTLGGTGLTSACDALRDQSLITNNRCNDATEPLWLCNI
jgi:hypothetical protein